MIISVEEETRHHKHQQKLPPTVAYATYSTRHSVLIENIPGFSLGITDTQSEIIARR